MEMAEYNSLNQKSQYAPATDAVPTPDNGLRRLADQIEQATSQIENISGNLTSVAMGIHGPRPEPVSAGKSEGVQAGDSFATRVSHLLSAVDRLQRSYESIVR
jgi:hypothetical protein